MRPLSKSSILTYERCPHSYFLQKVEGREATIIPKAMQRGSAVHELMDRFYNMTGNTVKEKARILCEKPEAKTFPEPIKNFIRFNEKMEQQGYTITPMLREERLTDIENNIVGIVDCVHKVGDKIIILDYKTGKKYPLSNFRFELALYTILLDNVKNLKATHWGILFVDHDDTPVIEPIDIIEIYKAMHKIEKTRLAIENKHFPKKPNKWCWNCICYQNGWCDGKL